MTCQKLNWRPSVSDLCEKMNSHTSFRLAFKMTLLKIVFALAKLGNDAIKFFRYLIVPYKTWTSVQLRILRIRYFLFYVTLNSQGHIAKGSLQKEETSAYCTVNHRASANNYQLCNTNRPAQDSNRRPQRLEARTLTATPPRLR